MEQTHPWSSERRTGNDGEREDTNEQVNGFSQQAQTKEPKNMVGLDTLESPASSKAAADITHTVQSHTIKNINEGKFTNKNASQWGDRELPENENMEDEESTRPRIARIARLIPETPVSEFATSEAVEGDMAESQLSTRVITNSMSPYSFPAANFRYVRRKSQTTIVLMILLAIVILQGLTSGPTQFLGSQGWASVLGAPVATSDTNLLKNIKDRLKPALTPGITATAKVQMTPQQYIDLIVSKMSLDQKLGQMMIVQFVGSTDTPDLSTMISQYGVGAVLVFNVNGNIVNKQQLTDLIRQMKANSATIPLAVAVDQEGGTVDRLTDLDGPRPAAATIGATNDPQQAKQAGIQDAQDLNSYGFNLNLAPVVDVTNVYNAQMYDRTFGDTPALVTRMASAYIQGLQKSGKVVGTLKHFPGLGDVSVDPHLNVPDLTRSKSDLEQIDWAPYRALIRQGNVHAIMVTHEVVSAFDDTLPASLSPKVIQGVLRNDLGFQGVVMTDDLRMGALQAYATETQAGVLAIEAGADLLMGPSSPSDVVAMAQSIKQAMSTGALTEQRINESVRRILMMKYAMGLLPVPQN